MKCFSKYAIFALFFLSVSSYASDSFVVHWKKNSDAKIYEYEIYNRNTLDKTALYRQGTSIENQLSLDLDPGYFYWRVRAIDLKGTAGAWSSLAEQVITAEAFEIEQPKDGETIEVPSMKSEIRFAWETVNGAQDYEVHFEGPRKITQISKVPSAVMSGLEAGVWKWYLVARAAEKSISKSKTQSVIIKVVNVAKPRFIEPRNNDMIYAYEGISVKWSPVYSSERSELEIKGLDLDAHIVFRKEFRDRDHANVDGLPPGNYQFTLREFLKNTEETTDKVITVTVKEDPLGYYKNYSGWSLRFMMSNFVGREGLKNYTLNSSGYSENTRPLIPGVDLQLQGHVYSEWGLEAGLRLEMPSYESQSTGQSETTLDRKTVLIGPTYEISQWGLNRILKLKALLYNASIKQLVVYSSSQQNDSFSITGLSLGADWKLSGWRPRWDLLSEARLEFPLMASQRGKDPKATSELGKNDGLLATGNSAWYLPSIFVRSSLRRKISEEWRLIFGLQAQWSYLRVNEKAMPTVPTILKKYGIGFNVGLQWDL